MRDPGGLWDKLGFMVVFEYSDQQGELKVGSSEEVKRSVLTL